ncbi:MAG: hypothetical protein QOD09_3036 [Bradyrhizobium sp.]|jgi:hypothetical protein|nr:hypothetical protein [Bradyrhizobium sp.]MEA2951579.1 hypothetical protein [Alphaproteobacteria bacterium]
MKADRRVSEEGLHIKYVGRNAYWIDGLVLFVGSAIALVTAGGFVANGVSADVISRAMVWLSCPWFLALYFLSYRLRKLAEGGFEIVLNFGVVPAYAAPLLVMIVVFAQFVKFWR